MLGGVLIWQWDGIFPGGETQSDPLSDQAPLLGPPPSSAGPELPVISSQQAGPAAGAFFFPDAAAPRALLSVFLSKLAVPAVSWSPVPPAGAAAAALQTHTGKPHSAALPQSSTAWHADAVQLSGLPQLAGRAGHATHSQDRPPAQPGGPVLWQRSSPAPDRSSDEPDVSKDGVLWRRSLGAAELDPASETASDGAIMPQPAAAVHWRRSNGAAQADTGLATGRAGSTDADLKAAVQTAAAAASGPAAQYGVRQLVDFWADSPQLQQPMAAALSQPESLQARGGASGLSNEHQRTIHAVQEPMRHHEADRGRVEVNAVAGMAPIHQADAGRDAEREAQHHSSQQVYQRPSPRSNRYDPRGAQLRIFWDNCEL